MEKVRFSELEVSSEIKRAVSELGYEEATAIQTQSIPLILAGKDVIGNSHTGSGKTAAFGIPAIEQINPALKGKTQCLILCPTRELAVQACDELHKFAKYKHGIRIAPVYGGQPIDRQIRLLKGGVEIIVGTPGRVMDHLRRRTLKLNNLSMIVLDEADEMLNMGFRDDIVTILKDAPVERQTILFSATMSQEIMKITKDFQSNPELVKIAHTPLTIPDIVQYSYEVPKGEKVEALSRLIDRFNSKRAIVFCNTKRMVDDLVIHLESRGFSSAGLHGDMNQVVRTRVMNAFKSGKSDILVATDVAARGIDVDDVDDVYNFDIPQDVEYYVHRIGRTGRAGKSGTAHILVCGRKQIMELRNIEKFTKAKIEPRQLPTIDNIEDARNEVLIRELTKELKKGMRHDFNGVIDSLGSEGFTTVEILNVALSLLSKRKANISVNNNPVSKENSRPRRRR